MELVRIGRTQFATENKIFGPRKTLLLNTEYEM
jgi:hypothetical protein